MEKVRKIAVVANHIKADDEDRKDVIFWLNKTSSERLGEVYRLRKNYYNWKNGFYPSKIEKVVHYEKL
ncbi:hypothetical protein U3A58_18535 [Algoriphagus sp. C2-6-M1]|uniref:hypothetical protein n=1 Tax=Algoriphagus persicinus TaxID=3108754 RepID=UPI002B3E1A67|nr:hypothetical protein [Algoriphagus sp. C2-6-M1]MEB2782393.1 hypothetical protein [Algoriphagus sp. C2-6-M1]